MRIVLVGPGRAGQSVAYAANGAGHDVVAIAARDSEKAYVVAKRLGAVALGPLAAHTPQELARWHAYFMRERILAMITPRARDLVSRHRDAGDLCAVVTATNSFVTAPIAREFGVPHLVATEPETAAGRFTGRVAGTPCFREGKIRRVDEWLAALGHWGPCP